jgi:hypothetical protein
MATTPEQNAQPVVPRVMVSAIVVVSVLTLTLILGVLLATRAAPPDVYMPPQEYLPGRPLPVNAHCAWPPSAEEIVHCHVLLEHDIYLVYDTSRGIITSTSVSVDNQATVGGLMLAWGIPSGIHRYPWSIRVQWDTRYIYVSSRPFRPGSVPYFIHYSLHADNSSPWEGFASWG